MIWIILQLVVFLAATLCLQWQRRSIRHMIETEGQVVMWFDPEDGHVIPLDLTTSQAREMRESAEWN